MQNTINWFDAIDFENGRMRDDGFNIREDRGRLLISVALAGAALTAEPLSVEKALRLFSTRAGRRVRLGASLTKDQPREAVVVSWSIDAEAVIRNVNFRKAPVQLLRTFCFCEVDAAQDIPHPTWRLLPDAAELLRRYDGRRGAKRSLIWERATAQDHVGYLNSCANRLLTERVFRHGFGLVYRNLKAGSRQFEFDVHPKGHAGLCLERYAKFSGACRSLDALLNMGQLLATFGRGKARVPPYQQPELAAHLPLCRDLLNPR